MNIKGTTTIKHEYKVEISREELLELVISKIPKGYLDFSGKLPFDTKVFVRVPGGADWSYCNLDIDPDTTVQVSFTYEVKETQ